MSHSLHPLHICSEAQTGKCHSQVKIVKDGDWATIVVSQCLKFLLLSCWLYNVHSVLG
jgi:hypothetical protein